LTFRAGYLTRRETDIWSLRRRRNTQSEIGRILGVSRQAINKVYRIIDQKVEQAFMEAADANHLEPRIVNLVEGIMEAYSPAYRVPVIVSLSRVNGVKVWYLYEGNCHDCHLEGSCRKTLEDEAEERGISLTAVDELRTPAQLASRIFGEGEEA